MSTYGSQPGAKSIYGVNSQGSVSITGSGSGSGSGSSGVAYTNATLGPAVAAWMSRTSTPALTDPAHISNWDTSAVTNMWGLFQNRHTFNDDISRWDVSNVTAMALMFGDAYDFNQNISGWNTTSCADFRSMFEGARSFNQNIGLWNVTNPNNYFIFTQMFTGATAMIAQYEPLRTTPALISPTPVNFPTIFGHPENVEYYSGVVTNANISRAVSQWYNRTTTPASTHYTHISNWNTLAVTNMAGLFQNKNTFNDDISRWDVRNVTTMENMFNQAFDFNQNISGWVTSSCTDFRSMFTDARSFNQNIGLWNVTNANNYPIFTEMFTGATALIAQYEPLRTTPALLSPTPANFPTIFGYAENEILGPVITNANIFTLVTQWTNATYKPASTHPAHISNWNTSAVTYMWGLFQNKHTFNDDISRWDVSNVTAMALMFGDAYDFNQNISGWDTSSCADFRSMFEGARSFNQNIGLWNVTNPNNYSIFTQMFTGATAMIAQYEPLRTNPSLLSPTPVNFPTIFGHPANPSP